jgi:histidine triad (HIT) family protein
MSECIFCKITVKEIPAELVYEDDQVIAFMDLKPVSPGHLLVVPKVHSQDILEAAKQDVASMFETARLLGNAAIKGLNAQGFNIGVNTKPAAGQVIFHTHVHVIPRYDNDPLKMWTHMENLTEELTLTAQKIKSGLV